MRGLLIAEKPSLRRTIEEVYKKHQSEIPYDITFMEQRGHLLTLRLPDEIDEEQKKWSWENLPFHPEEHGGWQYKIISEKKTGRFLTSKERYEAIEKELKSGKYDFVINAGDPDQEGELLICIVLEAMRNSLPVKRYWSNDTTEMKVLEGLKNLRDDDHDPLLLHLLEAAKGRQHSDYRFGMNVSRAATLKLGMRAACGRVKTPIMSIVCKRENEIANFKPSTCYGVVVEYAEGFTGALFDSSVKEDDGDDEEKDQEGTRGVIWFDTEAEAQSLMASLSSPARVIQYEEKRVETYAPKLFKLATAQIAAGKGGMSSSRTLEIIQSLYERGYLSYPRTDCEYISSGEDLNALLQSASSVPTLAPFIASIDPSAIDKVRNTKKWVNDKKLTESGHSALVPTTNKPDFESLSNEEKMIYYMICRQFVAIFLPPLVQDKTHLVTDISGNTFASNGKRLVNPGYTSIFGQKFTDAEIPQHREGDLIDVTRFDISSKTTTCPKRFTDATLIAVCEAPHKYLDDPRLKALGKKLKIGTPATRASIIEELISKDHYLQRSKVKKAEYIVPTEDGMVLYDNLKDLDICKVDLTGEWEEKLELVRSGDLSLQELEAGMRDHVEHLIEDIKNADIVSVQRVKEPICKCPACGGDIMEGKKGYYCSNYQEGCKEGAFKTVAGDNVITREEIKELLYGNVIKKKLSKGSARWEQELYYDKENHRIAFVEREKQISQYKCPCCGNDMEDDGRTIKCGCGFTFWKNALGVELPQNEIDSFFTTGRTGLIGGLKGKKGKFSAYIVLDKEKKGTSLEFENKPKTEAVQSEYKCPSCGGDLTDDGRTIKCGCGFTFWKTSLGVKLPDDEIRSFFKNGKTGLIKGLKGKKGPFNAYILYDPEKKGTKFEFGPRE